MDESMDRWIKDLGHRSEEKVHIRVTFGGEPDGDGVRSKNCPPAICIGAVDERGDLTPPKRRGLRQREPFIGVDLEGEDARIDRMPSRRFFSIADKRVRVHDFFFWNDVNFMK